MNQKTVVSRPDGQPEAQPENGFLSAGKAGKTQENGHSGNQNHPSRIGQTGRTAGKDSRRHGQKHRNQRRDNRL
jgi:hypothetical protein